MAYDEQFFDAYAQYLKEPRVRQAHDFVIGLTRGDRRFDGVVDFGCGMTQEFKSRGVHLKDYVGIDQIAGDLQADYRNLTADYRNLTADQFGQIYKRRPTAFVSLFSTEITADVWRNAEMYDTFFREVPSFQAGLVSGFYYVDRRQMSMVEETGGIKSYQSIWAPEQMPTFSDGSYLYGETWRVTLPVPSKMFGPDVIEVWRLLERR